MIEVGNIGRKPLSSRSLRQSLGFYQPEHLPLVGLPCPLLPLGRFANSQGTVESEMHSGSQREVLREFAITS
jgi:hypothetical protein